MNLGVNLLYFTNELEFEYVGLEFEFFYLFVVYTLILVPRDLLSCLFDIIKGLLYIVDIFIKFISYKSFLILYWKYIGYIVAVVVYLLYSIISIILVKER